MIETWTENIQIKGRVYEIRKEQNLVFCDCVIFDSNNEKKIEKRQFPSYLFENIKELKEGSLVLITIKKKSGAMQIEVFDAENNANSKDFEIIDLWNF